jgi:pyruvate/2-oxoglutarate dehydrogenase complex dihydrolipoamide acyltransferase (E2) component
VTGLGKDVDAAKGAAAASDAANAKVQAATGGTSARSGDATAAKKAAPAAKSPAAPAKSVPAKPKAKAKAATRNASAPLLRALDAKHAVVLVFWNRRGSDDRAVRRAVAAIDRHDGKVVVKVAPIAAVGRYEAITRGVQVLQSPTVLVIGSDHKARAIVGFTTTGELDQAVGDTLAAAKRAK